MRFHASAAAFAATFSLCAHAGDVIVENAAFRLTLGADGCAKSLVVKFTGEECLAPGVRIPFATLRQDRPYDNELHLMHAARPMVFVSDSIARRGDMLEIGFAREYHVMKMRLSSTDDYVAFVPEGTDYRITDDFGAKRRTEIDGIEFLRLPVKTRAHFGECANVAWDDKAAVAVMGLSPEVRIDGQVPEGSSGWRLMRAGTENSIGLFGHGAALVADARERWLDRVDAMERDHGLPRGVKNRRDPIMRASYCFLPGVTPDNADEYIAWMKKGGFRMGMVSYTSFAESCGHFTWCRTYPNGMADLKRVADRLRAAGVVPALHVHYNKVSIDDPYVKGGADPRIACVKEVCLAADAGPDDDELSLQGGPQGLRTENGRRLVRFGGELVSYESFTGTGPCRLLGVKRGLHGTPRLSHPRGEYGRHLDVDDWYRFHRVDQDTGLQDEIAGRIAEIVDACGFRVIYFDGGEDVPSPYWHNVPRAQWRVWRRIGRELRGAESALKSHFGWHMLSRGNAFDTFYPERTRQSLDKYILPAARMAADDFSTVDFGWLGFYLPGEKTWRGGGFLADNAFADATAGSTPEQIETAVRAAYENDAPISIQLSLKKLRVHPQADAIMAVFKKYEDMKFGDKSLVD
jgi:hypothetical protein